MDGPRTATERKLSSKHEDILRAATETFFAAGYERASMDEIAARAAVSKATVYSHFGNKEALFEAILHELCLRLVTPLRVGEMDQASPEDTLTAFARSYIDVLLDPASLALHRLLIAEAARNPELVSSSYRAGGGEAVRSLAQYLAREAQSGTLYIEDATLAAEQLFGMLNGHLQIRALLHVEPRPSPEAIERFISIAIRAFLRAHAPNRADQTLTS